MVVELQRSFFFGKEDYPVRIRCQHAMGAYPLHTHQFSELVVVTGGTGVHTAEGETWRLTAGDVIALNGRQSHSFEESPDLRIYNIMYDMAELAIPEHDLHSLSGYHALFTLQPVVSARDRFYGRLRLTTEQLVYVESIIEALRTELEQQHGGYRFTATGLFMGLIGYLSRCYSECGRESSETLLRVGKTISFLQNHLAEDITLEQLARMAQQSKRSFQRIFRQAMGASPIDYLVRLRVAKGCELLRCSEMSITEIAFEVGFKDSNYFARQFRKAMGQCPREFRKKEGLFASQPIHL